MSQSVTLYHKIASTKRPYRRGQLLEPDTSLEMRIEDRVWSFDATTLEIKLHQFLHPYHAHGEWFHIPPELTCRFNAIATQFDRLNENTSSKEDVDA